MATQNDNTASTANTTQAQANPNLGNGNGSSKKGQVGSPVSNEAYNVIAALQSKLEGLEAYRKYQKDFPNDGLWQRLTQSDTAAVQMLVQQLEKLVKDGKLSTSEQGGAS